METPSVSFLLTYLRHHRAGLTEFAGSGNHDKIVVFGSGGTVTQEDGNGGTTIAGNGNVLKRWGVSNALSFDNLAIANGNAIRESLRAALGLPA
jgi:hypothetical protein